MRPPPGLVGGGLVAPRGGPRTPVLASPNGTAASSRPPSAVLASRRPPLRLRHLQGSLPFTSLTNPSLLSDFRRLFAAAVFFLIGSIVVDSIGKPWTSVSFRLFFLIWSHLRACWRMNDGRSFAVVAFSKENAVTCSICFVCLFFFTDEP